MQHLEEKEYEEHANCETNNWRKLHQLRSVNKIEREYLNYMEKYLEVETVNAATYPPEQWDHNLLEFHHVNCFQSLF